MMRVVDLLEIERAVIDSYESIPVDPIDIVIYLEIESVISLYAGEPTMDQLPGLDPLLTWIRSYMP